MEQVVQWECDVDKLVTIQDGDGATMTGVIDIDSELYPGDKGCYDRIVKAHEFVARPDDVWIVGYPKCGAHWTYDIIKMVLAGSAANVKASKDKHFYEIVDFKDLEAIPSPRVIDTHLTVQRMPKDILDKKCKIIFNIRNPKDVAVSYYNHVVGCKAYQYSGAWNGFFKLFLEGRGEYNSWFDNVIGWWEYSKKHPEVLVLKYEDMIKDLPEAVSRVAKHLDKNLSDATCRQIADQCDFQVMKQRKKKIEINNWWKENSEGTFYRKGKVGDWKNWFTVSQNEVFDKVYEEQMKKTDLTVEFEV